MSTDKLSELKAVADYWHKVKSGELPAPGPNEISITACTLDGAVSRIAALLAELEASKKSNAFLKEQLSQLANFNPDWDMLEACRESWREVSAALKEAEAKLKAKDKRITTVTEEREFWRERVEGAEKEREEYRRRFNLERSYTEDADKRIAEREAKLHEARHVMSVAREAWLDEHDPCDGTDVLTPFDGFFYGEGFTVEAQPVVWVMIDDLTDKSIISTPAYRSEEDAEERTIGQIAPLFTAPPAPAVEEFGARRCCKDKKCNAPIVGYSVDGLCEDCYMEMSKRSAPVVNPEFTGATAVPDFKALAENLVENLVDCGGADEKAVEQFLKWTEKTCRAAMLAAAPEDDHE